MARIELTDGRLRVRLNPAERVFAMHGELDVDAALITAVAEVADPWPELNGLRWPGTGLPYIVCLGTLRHRGERMFTAVYGQGVATIVTLRDGEFGRIVVSGPAPHATLSA